MDAANSLLVPGDVQQITGGGGGGGAHASQLSTRQGHVYALFEAAHDGLGSRQQTADSRQEAAPFEAVHDGQQTREKRVDSRYTHTHTHTHTHTV
jgi:hypothetical protein